MKKLKLILNMSLIATMFLLGGCSLKGGSDDLGQTITENERKLDLKTPNGVYIAKDIHELKCRIAPIIEYSDGESKGFEIISINYEDESTDILAEIEYRTENGITSHLFITRRNTEISGEILNRDSL